MYHDGLQRPFINIDWGLWFCVGVDCDWILCMNMNIERSRPKVMSFILLINLVYRLQRMHIDGWMSFSIFHESYYFDQFCSMKLMKSPLSLSPPPPYRLIHWSIAKNPVICPAATDTAIAVHIGDCVDKLCCNVHQPRQRATPHDEIRVISIQRSQGRQQWRR